MCIKLVHGDLSHITSFRITKQISQAVSMTTYLFLVLLWILDQSSSCRANNDPFNYINPYALRKDSFQEPMRCYLWCFCWYLSPYVEFTRIRYAANPASLRLVRLRSSLHSLCDSPRYTLLTSYFFRDSCRLCARSESGSLGRPLQRLKTPFSCSLARSSSGAPANTAIFCAILN